MNRELFTVGHSTHTIKDFLELLALHHISAVVDVRSSPFSRFNPQFNQEDLQESLQDVGIRYVFLGKELGARSDDPNCYVADRVQYDRLAKTNVFQSGLARVVESAKSYRLVLMCAEREPLNCHRTILVARELLKQDFRIMHILSDGSLETHSDCVIRLISELGMPAYDLFRTRDEIVDEAYARQAEKIAYVQTVRRMGSIEKDSDSIESGATR